MDEPTAGLDPKGASEMFNIFINLNKQKNTTIIIVSHDNEMVYNFADNTVLMDHGKVIFNGLTLDLFNNKELSDKYNLLKPKIVLFKELLTKNGFKIDPNIRTIEELSKYLAKEINKK
ncbi:MAG: hypothetical protein IJO27_05175 [Bacilli bacterium]|nr:hypothetical protein [Bacilli bacterium]